MNSGFDDQVWLYKYNDRNKKQRRFFVLKEAIFYYFQKEPKTDKDFQKAIKSERFISINEKTKAVADGVTLSVEIPGRTYRLEAETPAVAEKWQEIISLVASTQVTVKSTSSVSKSQTNDALSSSSAIHSGWLTKKPEKPGQARRRFFELYSSQMKYFKGESADGKGKGLLGSIELGPTTNVSYDGLELAVHTPTRAFYLRADSAASNDAKVWADQIVKHTNASLTSAPKGNSRAQRPDSLLFHSNAVEDEADSQGSVPEIGRSGMYSNPSFRAKDGNPNSPSKRGSSSKVSPAVSTSDIRLSSSEDDRDGAPITKVAFEASQDEPSAMMQGESRPRGGSISLGQVTTESSSSDEPLGVYAGWLVKKKKRRYFILENEIMTYYEGSSGNAHGTKLKGSFRIHHDDKLTSTGPHGFQLVQASRTWTLDTTSETESKLWQAHISACIAGTADSKFEDALSGFFTKQAEGSVGSAQRRYFLRRSKQIDYFKSEGDGRGEEPLGSIPLQGEIKVGLSLNKRTLTIHTQARDWVLTASSDQQAPQWARSLLSMPNATMQTDIVPTKGSKKSSANVSFASPSSSRSAVTEVIVDVTEDDDIAELSGWFKKKPKGMGSSKERFFVVEPNLDDPQRIAYYVDAIEEGVDSSDSLKGHIAFDNIMHAKADGSVLVLSTPTRSYELLSENTSSVSLWARTINRLLQQRSLSAVPQTSHAEDKEEEDEALASIDPTQVILTGWFRKKGGSSVSRARRRFFVLTYDTVAYYKDAGKDDAGEDQLGAIKLTYRTETARDGNTLIIKNADRTWSLLGETADAVQQWLRAISANVYAMRKDEDLTTSAQTYRSVDDSDRNVATGTDGTESVEGNLLKLPSNMRNSSESLNSDISALGIALDRSQAVDMLPGTGFWLSKKNKMGISKSRFFKLFYHHNRMELYYFVKQNDEKPRGRIVIVSPKDISVSDKIIVINSGDRVWHLRAKSGEEAKSHAAVLTAVIARNQSAKRLEQTVPTANRTNVPLDVYLQHLLADPSHNRATILASLKSEFGERVVEQASDMIEGALNKQMVKEQNRPDKAGWLYKAAHGVGSQKHRFFTLDGSCVTYFESENAGEGVNEKGHFFLAEGDDIEQTNTKITLRTDERTWILSADSRAEASKWADAFTAGRGKNPRLRTYRTGDIGIDNDDDLSTEAEVRLPALGNAWVTKQGQGLVSTGKKRYVEPVYGLSSGKLKLRYYSRCDANGFPSDSKGFILLPTPQNIAYAGANISIKTDGREWKLKTAGEHVAEALCEQWKNGVKSTDRFQRQSGGASQSSVKVPVFIRASELLTNCESEGEIKQTLRAEYTREELEAEQESLDVISQLAKLQELKRSNKTVKASGWLVKKAEKRGKSRERFFQLLGTDIQYYVDANGDEGNILKGTIQLAGDCLVIAEECELLIQTRHRDWELTAKTEEDAVMWRDAINKAIEEAREIDCLLPQPRSTADSSKGGTGKGARDTTSAAGNRSESKKHLHEPFVRFWCGDVQVLEKVVKIATYDRCYDLVYGLESHHLKLLCYTMKNGAPQILKENLVLDIENNPKIKTSGKHIKVESRSLAWKLRAHSKYDAQFTTALWLQAIEDMKTFPQLSHKNGIPLCVRAYQSIYDGDFGRSVEDIEASLRIEYDEPDVQGARPLLERLLEFKETFGLHPEPQMAGNLVLGGKKEYYFELSDNVLRYYKKKPRKVEGWVKGKTLGVVPIRPVTRLERSIQELLVAVSIPKQREYRMRAGTVAVAEEWYKFLLEAKEDSILEAKKRRELMETIGFCSSTSGAEDAAGATKADWFSSLDSVFGQSQRRYFVLYGSMIPERKEGEVVTDEQRRKEENNPDAYQLLEYTGRTPDCQPEGRVNTYKLNSEMAIKVAEKVLLVTCPEWGIELEAADTFQSNSWATTLRELRRELRAKNKNYREEREEKARREIEEARRKAAEELAAYRGEVAAIAQDKFDARNLEPYTGPPHPSVEGDDAQLSRVPVLDENGQPVLDPEGNPMYVQDPPATATTTTTATTATTAAPTNADAVAVTVSDADSSTDTAIPMTRPANDAGLSETNIDHPDAPLLQEDEQQDEQNQQQDDQNRQDQQQEGAAEEGRRRRRFHCCAIM